VDTFSEKSVSENIFCHEKFSVDKERIFFSALYVVEFLLKTIFILQNLKAVGHEIFSFKFFHESVYPGPLSIQTGPFQIFSKIRGNIQGHRR